MADPSQAADDFGRSGRSMRIGGRASLPSGEIVTWSIADGRRGRRWREVTVRDGHVARSLAIETDPGGRVVRLEISTPAGLLTLHPDGDTAVLHGNVVTPDGIRHLTMGEGMVFVPGSPAAAAIALRALSTRFTTGETQRIELIRIDDGLDPAGEGWDVTRTDAQTWRLVRAANGETQSVGLDEDWLVELEGEVRWPLEL